MVNGREALIDAAQQELARVYGTKSPEYRRTPDMLEVDVLHYGLQMGWSTKRIALKLRMKQAEVTRILGAA